MNIPNYWSTVKLKNIGKVIRGVTYSKNDASEFENDESIPLLRAHNIQDIFNDSNLVHINKAKIKKEQIIRPLDVLVCMSSGSKHLVGKSLQLELSKSYSFGAFCSIVRPNNKIDPKILGFFMKSSYYRDIISYLSRGANINNLNKTMLENIEIPLPPTLEEQQEIVDILDKAQKMVQLRKEGIEHCEQMIPAIFYEMFGDPISNDKGWEIVGLSTLSKFQRGRFGHRPRNAPHLYGGNYPFIQTGDVASSGGRIRKYSQTLTQEGLKTSRMFSAGTIAITIAANIGETGILEFDSAFPDSLVGINVIESKCNNIFLEVCLRFYKNHLMNLAPAAAQKNINIQILNTLKIPKPSLEQQNKFAEIAEHFEKLKQAYQEGLELAEQEFQALLQAAFEGKLTAHKYGNS